MDNKLSGDKHSAQLAAVNNTGRNAVGAWDMYCNKNGNYTNNGQQATTLTNGGVNTTASLATPVGQCTVCLKSSVCTCPRCGDYYCSPQCQRIDWPRHRYICFPMPKLMYPPSLDTDSVFETERPELTVASFTNSPPEQHNHSLNSVSKLPSSSQVSPKERNTQNNVCNRNVANSQQSSSNSRKSKSSKRKDPPASMPISPAPKANSRVMITGFRSPNRCYVRSMTDLEDEEHMLAARKIDSYGKMAPVLTELPMPNTYAIAELDGVMWRVQILQVRNADGIRVLFCDRGITATRKLRDLREISNEIIRLQQYAVMVPLRNVTNYVMNEKLTRFLANFEDMEFKIKYDAVGSEVELLHWTTEKSLNDEINKLCQEMGIEAYTDTTRSREIVDRKAENVAADVKIDKHLSAMESSTQKVQGVKEKTTNLSSILNQEQHRVMEAPFEMHAFEIGAGPFKAVVLDVSCLDFGYIGCIAASDLEHLTAVHKQLESYKDTKQPYCPVKDEYCLAKYEDRWYRAKVIDIQDHIYYSVIYVDFTNEARVTSEDIRCFPSDLKGDCRSNLCLIDGLPTNLNEAHKNFLKEEVEAKGEIIIDRVKDVTEQIAVVECNNLLKKMNELGFL